jgi:CRISPR-associated protein Cas2
VRLLIAYDVATRQPAGEKRLRRVSRACSDYGVRVQKSVFECSVGDTDWVRLKARLLAEVDLAADSLRVYHLAGDTRVEHFGVSKPVDLGGPLIV